MALFAEQEVLSSFEAFKIAELEKGKSIGFFFSQISSRVSDKGDFEVCEGVRFDIDAKDIDALVESALASSFVPNTMMKNLIDSGSFKQGYCYRVEKAWNIGDKGKKGNPAKGFGYRVFKLNTPDSVISRLKAILNNEGSSFDTEGEEIGFEKPNL